MHTDLSSMDELHVKNLFKKKFEAWMEVLRNHSGLSYPLRLHLSGHQTNARPNSASEALREGAIDPGREQGRPGV